MVRSGGRGSLRVGRPRNFLATFRHRYLGGQHESFESPSVRVAGVTTSIRFEWVNIFNRPEFNAPFPVVGFEEFGELDSNDGTVPRTLQIMVRLSF